MTRHLVDRVVDLIDLAALIFAVAGYIVLLVILFAPIIAALGWHP